MVGGVNLPLQLLNYGNVDGQCADGSGEKGVG
jgi:hypothetical protein